MFASSQLPEEPFDVVKPGEALEHIQESLGKTAESLPEEIKEFLEEVTNLEEESPAEIQEVPAGSSKASEELQEAPEEVQEASEEVQEAPEEVQEASEEDQEASEEDQEASEEVQQGPEEFVTTAEKGIFSTVEDLVNQMLFFVVLGASVGFKRIMRHVLSFSSLVDSFSDQYKQRRNEVPSWYLYPYFLYQSVVFLATFVYNLLMYKLQQGRQTCTVTQLDHFTYAIKYALHGEQYEILLKQAAMQDYNLVKAEGYTSDDKEHDIVSKMNQLLGPSQDWHHVKYTPKQLGFKKIRLVRYNVLEGDLLPKTFEENDTLVALESF